MLTFKLDGPVSLTVTETLMSFTETRVRSHMIDIGMWRSTHPGEPTVAMDKASRDWAVKHYLPKVGVFDTEVCKLPICGTLGVRVRADGWEVLYDGFPVSPGEIPHPYLEMAKAAARREAFNHGYYTGEPLAETEGVVERMAQVKFNYEF